MSAAASSSGAKASPSAAAAAASGAASVSSTSFVDSLYGFDEAAIQKIRKERPWENNVKFFDNCRISALAAMKMLKHSLSGVEKGRKAGTNPIEVMGLLIGKFTADGEIIVLDCCPLPVEGSETRVVADDAQVYMTQLMDSLELRRKEGFVGWYHCFPTDDTRVLTDAGWLFHDEVLALVASERAPKFACYDVATRTIVYRSGKLVGPFASNELLDFTQADERRNWSDRSDAYGAKQPDDDDNSNHLSLRVTANHKMYVQLGTETTAGSQGEAPIQVAASSLLPGAAGLPPKHSNCPDSTHVAFLAAAHEGFGEPANVCALLRAELGLPSDEAALSFIELYGFWLGNGTLAVDRHNVQIGQCKQSDVEFLNSVLPACGLTADEWHVHERDAAEVKACRMPDFSSSLSRSSSFSAVAASTSVSMSADYEKGKSDSDDSDDLLESESDHDDDDDEEDGERLIERSQYRINNPRWWSFFWKEYKSKDGNHSKAQMKSANWLPSWVWLCSKSELRQLVRGLWRADGSWSQQRKELHTSSVTFRDELMRMLLHAGYATHFTCTQRAGERLAKHDQWRISFAEAAAAAASGINAVHPSMARADIGQVTKNQCPVWCVDVDHSDHLIIAQRAHRVNGVVTKASTPVIVGNSHPFDVETYSHCHLSAIDVQTQTGWQMASGSWTSIVVDPLRSLAKQEPELGVYRVYPPKHSPPPNECPDGTINTDVTSRTTRWGLSFHRYYQLKSTYFMSGLGSSMLEVMSKNALWVRILGSSSIMEPDNRQRFADRIKKATDRLQAVDGAALALGSVGGSVSGGVGMGGLMVGGGGGGGASHRGVGRRRGGGGGCGGACTDLTKGSQASSELAIEVCKGHASQIIKDLLFNYLTKHGAGPDTTMDDTDENATTTTPMTH